MIENDRENLAKWIDNHGSEHRYLKSNFSRKSFVALHFYNAAQVLERSKHYRGSGHIDRRMNPLEKRV